MYFQGSCMNPITSTVQLSLFSSNANQPFARRFNIFKVSIEGGIPENLNLGHGNNISFRNIKIREIK